MRHWDRKLSQPIHDLRLGALDYLLALPGMLFGTWGMPFTVLGLGLWLGWRFGLLMTAAAVATVAITNPMKRWIGRPRPEGPGAPRKLGVRSLVKNPSFPSGDSAQSAVVAAMLVTLGPWDDNRRWLFPAIAPLCMFSRVYFGAHWVGDTIAGAAIGASVGVAFAVFGSGFIAKA